jgi:hypothetical protein
MIGWPFEKEGEVLSKLRLLVKMAGKNWLIGFQPVHDDDNPGHYKKEGIFFVSDMALPRTLSHKQFATGEEITAYVNLMLFQENDSLTK